MEIGPEFGTELRAIDINLRVWHQLRNGFLAMGRESARESE